MMSAFPTSIEVVYCYVDADEDLRNELENHLSSLRHEGLASPMYVLGLIGGEFFTKEACIEVEAG